MQYTPKKEQWKLTTNPNNTLIENNYGWNVIWNSFTESYYVVFYLYEDNTREALIRGYRIITESATFKKPKTQKWRKDFGQI